MKNFFSFSKNFLLIACFAAPALSFAGPEGDGGIKTPEVNELAGGNYTDSSNYNDNRSDNRKNANVNTEISFFKNGSLLGGDDVTHIGGGAPCDDLDRGYRSRLDRAGVTESQNSPHGNGYAK